ncbi:MAG: hypothetical protein KAU83_05245 [Bacteroidales bacterium]|nr:hypothetical protein [Bacteroidales bacterium]
MKLTLKKGIDVKLNVKPAYLHLIHREAYEGPCRTGKYEQLTQEFDERIGVEKFEQFKADVYQLYQDKANILEPVYLTWYDDFILREAEWQKLLSDFDNTDLFLFDGVFHQFPGVEMAVRFKKPIGIIGCCAGPDAVSYLKTKSLESYGFIDRNDVLEILPLLRVKKAIRETNVMVVLKNDIISKGVLSTISNLEDLKNDLGIRFTFINAEEILEETDKVIQDKEAEELANQITDHLIDNADKSHMAREMVLKSVRFYVATKKLLNYYECNAFTIPCFEICSTRQLHKKQYTFCLTHSLLKDDGIPSACEADINVLMAMNVLINLTRKSPHMGNVHPVSNESKTDQSIPSGLEYVESIEEKDNLVYIFHAVPTIKMKGIEHKNVPYEIQSFTQGGWGATIRYDFNKDKDETITLLRFHPTGKKMFAAKGRIVAGAGFRTIGCSTGFYFQVNDVNDFFRKELEFGHHYAWVYGDYLQQLKLLSEVLNIDYVSA